ncbi:MAG: hypothetical protein Q8R70_01960 [Methanoregula sp.]|nr:hypothetical protein [Methanoregula sp.]
MEQPAGAQQKHGDVAIDLHNPHLKLSRTTVEHRPVNECPANYDGAPA